VPFIVNHIHLKSADPGATARWFCAAFSMTIESDTVRPVGDRFIRTMTEGGLAINISGERNGETLGPADDNPHYGLEHFGFDTADLEADIARLVTLGAVLKEGPVVTAAGGKIGFIAAPGGIRIELIQAPPS
jgi:catechol 2,3-dioxygenase-like lactoylglutathione lyase family enzyme